MRLSNPAHRQDYTVACLNYTLQTMMPLPGSPVMAPNAHDNNNATVPWPSVSEFILRVRLGGFIVFYIIALPHVTLGVTARELTNHSAG